MVYCCLLLLHPLTIPRCRWCTAASSFYTPSLSPGADGVLLPPPFTPPHYPQVPMVYCCLLLLHPLTIPRCRWCTAASSFYTPSLSPGADGVLLPPPFTPPHYP